MADYGENTIRCSFCGKRDHSVRRMLHAGNANICDECVALCYQMLSEEGLFPSVADAHYKPMADDDGEITLLKPAEIKAVLDQYVIAEINPIESKGKPTKPKIQKNKALKTRPFCKKSNAVSL